MAKPSFMNYTITFIRSMILMLVMTSFHSCKDKIQEYLLQESMKRLEQQNEIVEQNNQSLHRAFTALIDNDDIDGRLAYLAKYAKNFHESSDLFFEEINSARQSGTSINKNKLYQQYAAFQICLQQFKNSITDSFRYTSLDSNINNFLKLDEKSFVLQYLNASDSFSLEFELLSLKTDALLNEHIFLERTLYDLTPQRSCGSLALRAIATTNKCIYKKGDKLEVLAFLGNYFITKREQANMDGQNIEAKDGIFNYSRIITESPGTYRIPIEIILNRNGRPEVYPAAVNFTVE